MLCIVELERDFDRVLRNVLEWALRMNGIPVVLVRSVMMSLCARSTDKSQSAFCIVRCVCG